MQIPFAWLSIVPLFLVVVTGGCGPKVHPDERGAYDALANLGAEMDLNAEGRIASVELGRIEITDEDLRHLDHLSHVWCVSLYDTDISDAGMRHLADLHNLKWLDVENTSVTGKGLHEIQGLAKVITVWVGGTPVSDEEIELLKQQMPTTDFRR